jgi:hypothetical protein
MPNEGYRGPERGHSCRCSRTFIVGQFVSEERFHCRASFVLCELRGCFVAATTNLQTIAFPDGPAIWMCVDSNSNPSGRFPSRCWVI